MGKKEDYLARMNGQLKELETNIGALKSKLDKAEAGAATAYREQLETLHTKEDTFKKKLQELRGASDDVWEDMGAREDKAWRELEVALDNIVSRLK